MENGREVKKSFCLLSVAYIVLGLVLVIWPDISVHTFCFVFGIGMIIFGGAHMILYFTRDRFMNVMQPDLVIGVVCISTGCYILMKMEYMLEIIPFAMGIVALLGILDVFLLLGYALHGLILACAGFMVLMLILVTQDWQTIGVILAIVAGSSLMMFFGTGLTTLMRSIEFGLAEFVGS